MWIESLRTSFSQSRNSVMQSLLRDFSSIREEEYNEELVTEGLQLLFDILKTSKVSGLVPTPESLDCHREGMELMHVDTVRRQACTFHT